MTDPDHPTLPTHSTLQEPPMPTLHELLGNDPTFLPELRAWLQQHHNDQPTDGDSRVRAAVEDSALGPVKDDVLEEGECAHGVLTDHDSPALTCDDASAPVSPTESTEEREGRRTPGAPRHRTDPGQPRSDLMKRTRRSLVTEVLSLRRECAKMRHRARDAEDRLVELGEARRG